MTRLLKLPIFFIMLLQLVSCTPSPPYEIKSPCVSIESPDLIGMNPCIRRPANRDII